jgi:hypothetical protein
VTLSSNTLLVIVTTTCYRNNFHQSTHIAAIAFCNVSKCNDVPYGGVLFIRDESAERGAVELGRLWMDDDPESAGTLYVDGHVRVYHGHKTKPPRKFVSRQRLCLRGVSDYWGNDAIGRPFFVIDKIVDPGMLKVLRENIVPRLLAQVS